MLEHPASQVTVNSAIWRLKTIGKVQFTANDERDLNSLRTTRNAQRATPSNIMNGGRQNRRPRSSWAELSVLPSASLKKSSGPTFPANSSQMILGKGFSTSCPSLPRHMVHGLMLGFAPVENTRPAATSVANLQCRCGVVAASCVVIGKPSKNDTHHHSSGPRS